MATHKHKWEILSSIYLVVVSLKLEDACTEGIQYSRKTVDAGVFLRRGVSNSYQVSQSLHDDFVLEYAPKDAHPRTTAS